MGQPGFGEGLIVGDLHAAAQVGLGLAVVCEPGAHRIGNTDTANTLTQVNQLIKDGDLDRASRRLQSKLDQIEKSKGELAAAAPADERAKVNTTVDKQAEVLRKAQTRLKSAPKPSAPGGKRAGAVEVRNNQAAADPFRL